MKSFLLVFLGGGLGSGLRYIITITINQYSKVLPFGTFSAVVTETHIIIVVRLLIGMV